MLEKHWPLLPHSLPDAIEAWCSSPSVKASFGADYMEHYAYLKREEWKDFSNAVESPAEALQKAPVTPWEFTHYFNHA